MSKKLEFDIGKFFKIFVEDPFLIVLSNKILYLAELESLKIIQKIVDPDPEEHFYSAAISRNYVIVGGKAGIAKVLDINSARYYYLKGHGGPINDIKTHENKIYTCSDDSSIREWCLDRKVCLRVFGGLSGHSDLVLSIDVSKCGNFLASAGTDCRIKIWDLIERDKLLKEDINCNKSFSKNYNYKVIQFPIFSSDSIHRSYIKNVKFFGTLIVSKSQIPRISVIKPCFKTKIYKNNTSNSVFIRDFVDESFCNNFIADDKLYIASDHVISVFDDNFKFVDKIYADSDILDFAIFENYLFTLSSDQSTIQRFDLDN